MNSFAPPDPLMAARGMGPAVEQLDLTGAVSQVRSSLTTMDAVANAFARLARRSLPFLARYRTSIVPAPAGLAPGDKLGELAGGPPSFAILMTAKVGSGWGRMILDAGAIAALLDSALGGSPTIQSASAGAELTSAQRALVSRVGMSLAQDFSTALAAEGIVGVTLAPKDAPELPPTAKSGDIVHAVCQLEGLQNPAAIVLTVSPELIATSSRRAGKGQSEATHDPRMADALLDVPVEIVGELGRIKLSLRRVLGLCPGDVIRLDTAVDDPVTVRVGGKLKFEGTPVTSRGQMAIEVRSRHEP